MNQICEQSSKAIISSSAPLGWDGVSIARGRMDTAVFDQAASPQHHFCMIVRNRLTWECGNEGKRMKRLTSFPGRISIYPADLTTTRCINEPFEFIALTLAPVRISQGLRGICLENRMEFLIHHNVDDPQLRGLMNMLLGEAEAGNPNGRLFVESLAQAVSIHYVKQYAVKRDLLPENRYSLSAHQRRRVLDYIEDNLVDELSLDAMAKEVGLSKYYFCTLFKQSIGKTPYQYVLQRRLERAKVILHHGKINIAEVAQLFGFSDQSHFSRSFKRFFGITPGQFLKSVDGYRN